MNMEDYAQIKMLFLFSLSLSVYEIALVTLSHPSLIGSDHQNEAVQSSTKMAAR